MWWIQFHFTTFNNLTIIHIANFYSFSYAHCQVSILSWQYGTRVTSAVPHCGWHKSLSTNFSILKPSFERLLISHYQSADRIKAEALWDTTECWLFNTVYITRISVLHPISVDTMSILESAGSSGNSSMFLPSGVNEPVLSRAPRTHNWYIEFIMLSYKAVKHHNLLPLF